MKEVYIFGHKSPDTDAICSIMAKERLDRLDGKENHKSYRLGDLSKETQFVMDYLNIEPPEMNLDTRELPHLEMIDINTSQYKLGTFPSFLDD